MKPRIEMAGERFPFLPAEKGQVMHNEAPDRELTIELHRQNYDDADLRLAYRENKAHWEALGVTEAQFVARQALKRAEERRRARAGRL